MPRPSRVCPVPGCPTLVPGGGRCPTHRAQAQRGLARQRRANGEDSMSVYSTTRWRTTRTRYLRTHTQCVVCHAKSTVVDHVVPRAILMGAGVHRPDDHQWLQPLCKPCHDRKTASIDQTLINRFVSGESADALASEALARWSASHLG